MDAIEYIIFLLNSDSRSIDQIERLKKMELPSDGYIQWNGPNRVWRYWDSIPYYMPSNYVFWEDDCSSQTIETIPLWELSMEELVAWLSGMENYYPIPDNNVNFYGPCFWCADGPRCTQYECMKTGKTKYFLAWARRYRDKANWPMNQANPYGGRPDIADMLMRYSS